MPTMFCENYTAKGVVYRIDHVTSVSGQSYYKATPVILPGQVIKHTNLDKLKCKLGTSRDPDGRYQR